VTFNNASFNYDGDGKRVKSVETTSVGTTTTYFVGGHYELTGAESTKYYFAGSTRIAMRKGTTLYYLLGDHLGSTCYGIYMAVLNLSNNNDLFSP